MAWNIPLVSLAQLSWLCCILASCPPWAYSLARQTAEGESLDAVQVVCSNSQKAGALPTLFLVTNPKHSTVSAAMKTINAILYNGLEVKH